MPHGDLAVPISSLSWWDTPCICFQNHLLYWDVSDWVQHKTLPCCQRSARLPPGLSSPLRSSPRMFVFGLVLIWPVDSKAQHGRQEPERRNPKFNLEELFLQQRVACCARHSPGPRAPWHNSSKLLRVSFLIQCGCIRPARLSVSSGRTACPLACTLSGVLLSCLS